MKRITVLLIALILACGGNTISPTGVRAYSSSPVPIGLNPDLQAMAGYVYEPVDNWWNQVVRNAPVDPNSAQIITKIKSYDTTYAGRLHPDFTPDYGIPFCVVDRNTPMVNVVIGYPAESDLGPYPIPAAAKTNPRYFENSGRSDGDGHLLIFEKDARKAYELAYTKWDGTKWTARYGAIFDLKTNARRPEGWTSTDAAGLCVFAGLVRYDEMYGIWPIRHAIRCSIKQTNGHVWPASHTGATDPGAPPLGTRLRLKASFNVAGYPPHVAKVLNAMKTYGLIVADRGGNMYVQGTMDTRWDNGVLNPAFHSLHITDFEVIKQGWKGP